VADIGRNRPLPVNRTPTVTTANSKTQRGRQLYLRHHERLGQRYYSRDSMNSDFASVNGSGIFAGSGGFDIVEDRSGNGNRWEYINKPFIEDITLSKKRLILLWLMLKNMPRLF
jgi:hypothetical protein